jgi:hypothetical protein
MPNKKKKTSYPLLRKIVQSTWDGLEEKGFFKEAIEGFPEWQLDLMEGAAAQWSRLYADGAPFLSEIVMGHHEETPDVDNHEEGSGVLLIQVMVNRWN